MEYIAVASPFICIVALSIVFIPSILLPLNTQFLNVADDNLPNTSSAATTVVATRCEFANSSSGAVVHGSLTSATFKNCVFNDNEYEGIIGASRSTIHLHGEATAIHSNGNVGILAYDLAKVILHLPSHHNTIYNNGDARDTFGGGTITNVED